MAPKHEIEIVIQPDGTFEATVLGIEGAACSDISKFLDQLGQVVKDEKTADYHKRPKAQGVQIGGRYGR